LATSQTDNPVERLVARSMRVRSAAPREACPDADVLAAFADRSLDRRETRRIERHASSCWRCAHVVSAVLAADPLAGLRPRPAPWRAWGTWRWAVPVATAAIVAGVWLVSTPENLRTDTARVSAPPAAAAPSVNQAVEEKAATATREQPERTLADNRTAAAPPSRVDERRQGFGGRNARTPSATDALKESVPLERDVESLAKAESADAAAPARAGAVRRSAEAAAPAAAAAAVLDAVAAPPIVPSPDPRTLWRGNGTAIERSTDGGNTWTLQYTADRPILGGTAASTDVAWFFGRGGLVLRRTVSGWSVATARPGNAEIASINPGGPAEAVVTLVDGRRFETLDGGVSWVARSP
jgi:hypothetical protein